jgi:hypothetical protein
MKIQSTVASSASNNAASISATSLVSTSTSGALIYDTPPSIPAELQHATPDKIFAWLSTAQGQAFLSMGEQEAALSLYRTGNILDILHRPDWPSVRLQFW